MFDNLFQHLTEQQRRDGAVDHPEFEVSHGIGAMKLSSDDRGNLEAFVVDNTTEAHRYMTAKGKQGIVYYDQRGRGAMCVVEEIPDEELFWLAQQKGWKKPANPDPGDEKGGYDYQPPIEESAGKKVWAKLQKEFPGWPLGDLKQAAVSVSPRMSRDAQKVQARYQALMKKHESLDEIGRVLAEARAGTQGQSDHMRGAEVARTAVVYQPPIEEGVLAEGLKSREKLYDALKELTAKGIEVKIPSSYKKLSNEVYGKKAMIYVDWGSPADKVRGEKELKRAGFKPSRYDVASSSEIQVSYFKGWHWDEDIASDVANVLAEARTGTQGQRQWQLGSRAGMGVVQVVLNNWKKKPKDIKGWLKIADEYVDVPRHIGSQWMAGFKHSLIGQRMWKEGKFRAKYGEESEYEDEPAVIDESDGLTEDIQVIPPYANGMWVVRFEDYLYKITGKKKWKWKKPILKRGNELRYKWTWARKAKGAMFAPIVQLVINYDRGNDLFDVSVEHYDADMNKIREKKMRGMYTGDITDPEKMLGWMRRAR